MVMNARGFRDFPSAGLACKLEKLCELTRNEGLTGALLSRVHNFAWLTSGRSNRIDGSRETGVAHLLIAADGRRWILSSTIEADRMSAEVVDGLGFDLIDYPWEDERADPTVPARLAARLLSGPLGADTAWPDTRHLEPALARLRCRLDPHDVQRYRVLGADAAQVLGAALRALEPGVTEIETAVTVARALTGAQMRPIVLLVGADDRIGRYRHPVPTSTPWNRRLLVGICAERDGLVVALSRMLARDRDADLDARVRACAMVFARLVEATNPGVSGSELYHVAADAYAAVGFPDEQRRHHQGGAIGYCSREWVAHPGSRDVVAPPQAFAWNPTITGAKVEETLIVNTEGGFEVLTHDPWWPSWETTVHGQPLRLPVALEPDA